MSLVPYSVLVVEDNDLLRVVTVECLKDEGFEVFEAHDADAAIELLIAQPSIRLMFTDIDMPGSMDGLKLSAAVRSRWPPVHIVITSGHHVVAARDLPDGGIFVGKPYVQSDLALMFRALIET